MVWLGLVLFGLVRFNDIYCISIIIIMSHYQLRYPWPSLATPPYCLLLPVGLQDNIPYRHRAAVWSSCLCTSMWWGPQEYIIYELVPISPAVSRSSGSFNFDSFRDAWYVAVQLGFCGVLSPGFVQNCSQHSSVVAIKLFLHLLS